ncbi:4Fe-4S dicluster domain-containing protein [Thermodesulfobacteriota bacterium]
MRWGMLIDLIKCAACYGCAIKCKQEHFLPPFVMWGKILMSEEGKYPNAIINKVPVLCNHCEDAVCVEVCPTGATEQREDGIVWVDQDQCIGCRYCLVACPYQARTYNDDEEEYFPGQGETDYEKMRKVLYPLQKGVVTKCNFCKERIDEGQEKGLKPGEDRDATPACVNACPNKARYFGDLDDPDSNISVLIREKRAVPFHPEHGTDPQVYYVMTKS